LSAAISLGFAFVSAAETCHPVATQAIVMTRKLKRL
jgi:hypothetical protein